MLGVPFKSAVAKSSRELKPHLLSSLFAEQEVGGNDAASTRAELESQLDAFLDLREVRGRPAGWRRTQPSPRLFPIRRVAPSWPHRVPPRLLSESITTPPTGRSISLLLSLFAPLFAAACRSCLSAHASPCP